MNEPTFTPGPWAWFDAWTTNNDIHKAPLLAKVGDSYQSKILEVIDDSSDITIHGLANAALIAAAPELYEALEELVLFNITEDEFRAGPDHLTYDCNECGCAAEDDHALIPHDPDCTVGKANAALKKARGDS